MKKKKVKEIEENLNEAETGESFEPQNIEPSEPDSLEERFKKFSEQSAEFKPEQPTEGTPINPEQVGEPLVEESAIARQIKIKMFVGFSCFVLAGFGTWLLNMIKGTKVPVDKMYFTPAEKESLMPYMDDPRILEFIDKLPTWVIAAGHIGFMINSKHELYAKEFKVIKKSKTKEDE